MDKCNAENVNIYVLNLGWVVVGIEQESHNIDNNLLNISNSFVVRRWGTSHGLGELATNGPLESTILDSIPQLKINTDSIIMILKCDASKWQERLKNIPLEI